MSLFKKKSLTRKFYLNELNKIREIVARETKESVDTKYVFISNHTCSVHTDVAVPPVGSALSKIISSFDDSKRRIFEENRRKFMKRLLRRKLKEVENHVVKCVKSFMDNFSFDRNKINLNVGACADPDCLEEGECEYMTDLGRSMSFVMRHEPIRSIIENFLSVVSNANVVFKSSVDEDFAHTEFWLQRRL